MTFTKAKDYNGKTGKVYNEEFEVQILPDERKYFKGQSPSNIHC